MPKIEYVKGIKCKKCGDLITPLTIFTKELCQKCGANLLNISLGEKTYVLGPDAEEVTIKITHKFFNNIYEEV